MEVQRLSLLVGAMGLSVAMHSVCAAEAVAPAKPSTVAASSQTRVQGAIPAGKPAATASKKRATKRVVERRALHPSEGQLAGLHKADDPLDLKSSVALVVNQDTDEVLFAWWAT